MTTKNSSLSVLKVQADKIAATLKAAERGDKVDVRYAEKIAASRSKESFRLGIVMDDKVITIDMPWTMIGDTSEAGIAEYILKQMREARDTVN